MVNCTRVILVAWGIIMLLIVACIDDPERSDGGLSAAEAMAGDTTGYERVTEPRAFTFPEDHGPHPDYKTEWWYVTGNLDGENDREFGYQFTIFRIGLRPPDAGVTAGASSWRTDQMYMGHFGLSDIQRQEHIHGERFSRGAAGLAGAEASPFRIWVDNWSAEAPAGEEPFPMNIRAQEGNAEINLILTPDKPRVYQGDRGYSRKGALPGDASYYFSYTRLSTEGWVVVQGDTISVTGYSWMDREWSTSALSEEQVGWDWFSLQLDDYHEMMFYHIREEDSTISPYSKGLFVRPDGSTSLIDLDEVTLTINERWQSPRGGAYPVAWTLDYEPEDILLNIEAYFPDQEMATSVRYWEGAVRIEGSRQGSQVAGRGFVEMTGYGDQQMLPR